MPTYVGLGVLDLEAVMAGSPSLTSVTTSLRILWQSVAEWAMISVEAQSFDFRTRRRRARNSRRSFPSKVCNFEQTRPRKRFIRVSRDSDWKFLRRLSATRESKMEILAQFLLRGSFVAAPCAAGA